MNSRRSVVVLCVFSLVLALLMTSAVEAGDREGARDGDRDIKKIMSGLEQGIKALKALGMEDEAERLTKIAKAAYHRFAAGQKERQTAENQIEVMRLAMKALLEADKHDAAERLEQKIHAIELSLAGRRDEEANRIRETAPGKGEVAELLHWASKIWMEFGHESKAEMVAKLARQFAEQESRGRKDGGGERRMLERHTEILRHAMNALREAERKDLVGQLEREVHALKMNLDGRKDPESMAIRRKAPPVGSVAEILFYSAKLWEKFGNQDKAEACFELGRHYQLRHHQEREREKERGDRREGGNTAERVADLERQIEELMKMMDRLHGQLEELKRETR